MSIILDKYQIANQLRLVLDEIEKPFKFKNFKIKFSSPTIEDIDVDGEDFLLKFKLFLLNNKYEILTSAPAVVMHEEKIFYFKAGWNNIIRRKGTALKANYFFELSSKMKKKFKKIFNQVKILDAYFKYFKDDDPRKYEFWISDEKISQNFYINNHGGMITKIKKFYTKNFRIIIEFYLAYQHNEIWFKIKTIDLKKNKKKIKKNLYKINEKNALSIIAKKWKEIIIENKKEIENLEAKYKTQKFSIKKL